MDANEAFQRMVEEGKSFDQLVDPLLRLLEEYAGRPIPLAREAEASRDVDDVRASCDELMQACEPVIRFAQAGAYGGRSPEVVVDAIGRRARASERLSLYLARGPSGELARAAGARAAAERRRLVELMPESPAERFKLAGALLKYAQDAPAALAEFEAILRMPGIDADRREACESGIAAARRSAVAEQPASSWWPLIGIVGVAFVVLYVLTS